MNPRFDAILFDLDGTLLDTIEDLADCMNRCMNKRGFAEHGYDAYKLFVGDGVRNLAMRALSSEHRSEAMLDEIVADMRVEYAAHWADKTHAYQGIPELLADLASRGIPCAVLSNKPDDFTKAMVCRFFPHISFAAAYGARAGVPHKPDPQAALAIAHEMNVRPDHFLYVGDTSTDMRTAISAGMFPLGVLWGFRGADELLQYGARQLVAAPAEILKFILA
ncbi:MAG: hypothetical protein A2268_01965 [Candidatus Raymondbacteria bacterium RifOxyA12_full_50_37]|uniref:HAD family hydrolase n=1 Tax=Candidatus Raymondbacteria bacterium RIFOXYD12_FULL_49_13 TaxID=1817890 RepID=A0A1F7F5V9_UNCRA|nr:MAG: hypothetical protein A2268_01965 [Candidatus Raymondbacteria bacterium RifOxyA12_full_50_37]OGJ92109.1 MAG: hypothetical protein A2248_10795 [Candidatus Raymondbacteria bacterium RIFOXYA2_FULL_49_16]OGJ98465.1 MAG: hypothetical protein A2453_07035 [Candidatus Raymondbacteria bacterium RIFOXYC2_FULL_50_21]OGK00250.1 MAG: hypothetical protein A2350_05145 [Candidatus Raymondbacteria bacterium RifOxyB12_full_50_8]OGK02019.1 MAG: hypothetical protein A2519_17560 [Candidatus Raymondbacteria b